MSGGNVVNILFSGGPDLGFVSPSWIKAIFGQTPSYVTAFRAGLKTKFFLIGESWKLICHLIPLHLIFSGKVGINGLGGGGWNVEVVVPAKTDR